MKFLFLVLALVLVSSCVTTKTIYLSDGEEGYNIDCSSDTSNLGDCYAKASDLCGINGYQIYNFANGVDGTTPIREPTDDDDPQPFKIVGYEPHVTRNLTIRCNTDLP